MKCRNGTTYQLALNIMPQRVGVAWHQFGATLCCCMNSVVWNAALLCSPPLSNGNAANLHNSNSQCRSSVVATTMTTSPQIQVLVCLLHLCVQTWVQSSLVICPSATIRPWHCLKVSIIGSPLRLHSNTSDMGRKHSRTNPRTISNSLRSNTHYSPSTHQHALWPWCPTSHSG